MALELLSADEMKVAWLAAAVVWAVATSASHRNAIVDMHGVALVQALLARALTVAKASETTPQGRALAFRAQAHALGALAVLTIDVECREQYIKSEPDLACLIECCGVDAQMDAVEQEERRTTAAKIITACIQRDGDVRMSAVEHVRGYHLRSRDILKECSCPGPWQHWYHLHCLHRRPYAGICMTR